jgi:quinol-cytochrome oxidoreductase complex cytochrome b subunit
MAQSKSDKPFALTTILASLFAVIISYILLEVFTHQVADNFKNTVYLTVVIILSIAFLASSIWAYNSADDGGINDNRSRAFVIIIALIMIIWAGGWVAGSNEKVTPGSPQMEDVR